MPNYHVCPTCKEAIDVEKYDDHIKTHGKIKDKTNLKTLKRTLDDAEKSWKQKGDENPVTLFFEIAKRIFSKIEKVDTSSWDYVFDTDVPDLISDMKIVVPSPHPPVMCHIKFAIKDKAKFEELIEKYKGTEKEQMLKEMVSTSIPTVVVFRKELGRLFLQWSSEGKSSSNTMITTVFFFLHEMYHIIGFGEKDSSVKASIAIHQFFGMLVVIPEHEIQRWKLEEELKKKK